MIALRIAQFAWHVVHGMAIGILLRPGMHQEEPILVLTRREGTDFVLTLDSPVHLRYLRTCDTCVPTCVTLTA